MQPTKKNFEYIILFSILILGSFLRFYKLAEIPNGFYVDEAAIGYNAYSLLLTGKDEFGYSMPTLLRWYGAYVPPLYSYLTTIPIIFGGLTIFSTRFVSAISGTISILLIYVLARNLHVFKNSFGSLLVAFVFALSPWSIFFSRAAFEANLGLMLLLASLVFIVLIRKSKTYIIYSFFFLSLSTYAYHAERFLAYLLIPSYLVWESLIGKTDRLFKNRMPLSKYSLLGVGLFLLLQVPYMLLISTEAFSSRAGGVFYLNVVEEQATKIPYLPSFVTIPVAFVREFLSQYIGYFSLQNLFYVPESDLQRSIPDLSVWYLWMIVPFVVGLFTIMKGIEKKNFQFLVILLLLAPIPAALAKDPFSTVRSLPLIIPTTFVISLGIERVWKIFGFKTKIIIAILTLSLTGISLWRSYFVLFPNERARYWDYGYIKLTELMNKNQQTHFLIDQSRVKPSYIHIAFHSQYPPIEMQEAVDQSIKDNYYNAPEFNSYYFINNTETRNIVWEEDIFKKQILVGDSLSISDTQAAEHHLTKVFEIKDPLYETLFVGYETNPEKKCESIKNMNSRCTIMK